MILRTEAPWLVRGCSRFSLAMFDSRRVANSLGFCIPFLRLIDWLLAKTKHVHGFYSCSHSYAWNNCTYYATSLPISRLGFSSNRVPMGTPQNGRSSFSLPVNPPFSNMPKMRWTSPSLLNQRYNPSTRWCNFFRNDWPFLWEKHIWSTS